MVHNCACAKQEKMFDISTVESSLLAAVHAHIAGNAGRGHGVSGGSGLAGPADQILDCWVKKAVKSDSVRKALAKRKIREIKEKCRKAGERTKDKVKMSVRERTDNVDEALRIKPTLGVRSLKDGSQQKSRTERMQQLFRKEEGLEERHESTVFDGR